MRLSRRLQRAQERQVASVVETLHGAYVFSLPSAHRYDCTVFAGFGFPALALGDDASELAPETRVALAIPHFAKGCLEDVAERTALEDAARRDGPAGANDERVPSDDARLLEAGALAIDAAAAARAQLMLDLLAPREVAASEKMRDPLQRAVR